MAAQNARIDLPIGKQEMAAYLEDVSAQIDDVVHSQSEFVPKFADPSTRLDLIFLVSTGVTRHGHNDDLFEAWYVDHLHVRHAGSIALSTVCREFQHLKDQDIHLLISVHKHKRTKNVTH